MTAPEHWTGHEARLLRTALRLSLRAFAAHLGVAERTVSKWESAGRSTTPWPESQAILDTALARASEDTRARFEQLVKARVAAARPGRESSAPATTNPAKPPPDTAQRPEVDAIDAAQEHLFDEFGHNQLGLDIEDDDEAGAEPWSVAEVIGRFSMPLSLVERMERLAFVQVARYPHTAPPEMWPVVRRELKRVRQALDRRQAVSVQLRLTKVAGVLAGVAGNLSVDVGRRETALEYFDLSRLAGRESDDADLTAWAVALESIDSFFNSHVEHAVELLEQAAALSHRGSSARRRAWIAALHARAYAVKRDSVNACTALDRAMNLIRDADVPSGSDFFDQERLNGMAGTTYLYLGDTDRALKLIDSALDRRSPADSKGRALLALDKAACWVRADQPENAFEAIHAALDLTHDQFVRPISTRAREVIAEMSRWPTTAAGRSCHERLRDLGS